jgi:hypothetical protein
MNQTLPVLCLKHEKEQQQDSKTRHFLFFDLGFSNKNNVYDFREQKSVKIYFTASLVSVALYNVLLNKYAGI